MAAPNAFKDTLLYCYTGNTCTQFSNKTLARGVIIGIVGTIVALNGWKFDTVIKYVKSHCKESLEPSWGRFDESVLPESWLVEWRKHPYAD